MESTTTTTIIIAAATAAVGAILGAGGVTPLVVAVMHSRRESTKATRDFSVAMFERMESRITALEASERECMEAKEQLSVEVGTLRGMVETMERQIVRLQKGESP